MLATLRQIQYLQLLADRTEYIKERHPSLIPQGLMHTKWDIDMTSEKAGLRIQMYRSILNQADAILHPWKKVAETDDLPM